MPAGQVRKRHRLRLLHLLRGGPVCRQPQGHRLHAVRRRDLRRSCVGLGLPPLSGRILQRSGSVSVCALPRWLLRAGKRLRPVHQDPRAARCLCYRARNRSSGGGASVCRVGFRCLAHDGQRRRIDGRRLSRALCPARVCEPTSGPAVRFSLFTLWLMKCNVQAGGRSTNHNGRHAHVWASAAMLSS